MSEPVLNVASSASGRRWIWREAEERTAMAIAQRLALPELLGRLLAARGITIDTAADWLDPTLRAMLPDPSVMADMDVAALRIAKAVAQGETVAVFGDYDVDGACSGALMVLLLRELGCTVFSHVPHRLTEGYGPNAPALVQLCDQGATLVICVDCGTAAVDIFPSITDRADVIVLDHHKVEGRLPAVVAVVNPNRLDDTSGLGSLCAGAVAFLTGVAVVRQLRRDGFFSARAEPDMIAMLDLVALSTVCDVMPLTGVNRALVAQGLKVMSKRARPGIAALLEVAGVKDTLSAFTCGFALGPRINAAGRIDDPGLGLRLLTLDDPLEARLLAERLDEVNRQRQLVEGEILDVAMAEAERQSDAGHAAILVSGEGWHPGVVGIVAGRIKEKFNRPACVAAIMGGEAKGSGRSIPGLDLGSAIIVARQSGLLTTGGGHAMAAGFSLPVANLGKFHDLLNERLTAANFLPSAADLPVDGSLAIGAASVEMAQLVSRMAPFGSGNEEPIFVLPRVRVVRADLVGKESNTVRVFLDSAEGGARLKAVMFRAKDTPLADLLLHERAPIHLAGYLRAETWNGNTSASFIIIDGVALGS